MPGGSRFVITPPLLAQRTRDIAASLDLRALPPDFYANPYPVYDLLRAQEPGRRMPDDSFFLRGIPTWSLSIATPPLSAPTRRSSSNRNMAGASALFEHHTKSLVFNDPPLHTRVRQLSKGTLTWRAIADMEPALITLVNDLLDKIEAKGGGDLIKDFVPAIPVEIIGNLLGVSYADRAPLRQWSLAILGALEPQLMIEQEASGNRYVREFTDYLKTLIAGRHQNPGNPDHDVLARLMALEPGGGQLSESELLQNCMFMLNAGHETTTNLIGNALVALQKFAEART